jgi:hypothetical protein
MSEQHILIIEAGRTERHYWKDLWRYRELFYFLAWRDILVRYTQTVNGSVCRTSRGKLRNNGMTAMTAKVISGEQEVLQEAMEGLLQHRDPAKAARFWAAGQTLCSGRALSLSKDRGVCGGSACGIRDSAGGRGLPFGCAHDEAPSVVEECLR